MALNVPPRFFPDARLLAEAEKHESDKAFHAYAKQLRPAMREAKRQNPRIREGAEALSLRLWSKLGLN